MTIIKPFEKELKKYCEQNSLSYDKVISFPRCGNENILFIQRINKKKAVLMGNNEPAEILLTATVNPDGAISFEKGPNAEKYLHV